MALNVGIFAEFLVAAAMVAGGLAIIGHPVRVLLLDGRDDARSPVPSVVVGLAILQLVCWYWLSLGGEGVLVPAVALLAIGGLGSVLLLIRSRPRRPSHEGLAPLIGALGLAVLFFVVFSAMFELPFHTTASLGNNDAVSYATVAEHLRTSGFGDAGNIAGSDLGEVARHDGFGATAVLGATAAVTGIDVWKLTMPTLFVFVVLGGALLARLVVALFPDAPVQSGLAAAAGCAGLLFFYVVGQYFLGQVMAMAIAPLFGVLALSAREAHARAALIRLAGGVATVVVVFLSHYVQMLAPALIVLGAGALVAPRGDVRIAAIRIGGVLGAGVAVGALLAPQMVIQGVERTRQLTGVTAGWVLPGLLPSELVGALDTVVSVPHGAGGYTASLLLLAVLTASLIAVWSTRPTAARYVSVTLVLILGSYFAVYALEGASYRQWKWITFFQPLFAALVFAVVALALTDWIASHRPRVARGVVCVSLAGLAATLLAVGGFAHTPMRSPAEPPVSGDETLLYVDPPLSNLGVNRDVAAQSSVEIDLASPWDTMWGVYFLRDHAVGVESWSYYPPTTIGAQRTLTPRNDAINGPTVKRVNERFQFEPNTPEPTSASLQALGSLIRPDTRRVTVQAGGALQVPMLLANTGTATWLPTGATPGSVNLGGRLMTPKGQVIDAELLRQAPVPGRTQRFPPGVEANTLVQFASPPPGRYRIEFQLVSEQVGWFGETATVRLVVTAPE